MVELAEAARVSVSTVKRFEDGALDAVKPATVGLMQVALETEGVRFLPDDGNGIGLRYQPREVGPGPRRTTNAETAERT